MSNKNIKYFFYSEFRESVIDIVTYNLYYQKRDCSGANNAHKRVVRAVRSIDLKPEIEDQIKDH